jgi:excisionase family DNA binding protein
MTTGSTNPEPERRPTAVPELLTVDEVAQALRLSRSKVYELIASRQLRAFRPGGRIRIPAEAVWDFLKDSRL